MTLVFMGIEGKQINGHKRYREPRLSEARSRRVGKGGGSNQWIEI